MPEIQKVTDPAKVVTDPLVLDALAEQGIDKDYVEFFQDYAPRSLGKEHSPYAKFYRDLKSGKHIMVVSGLPMVNADGVMVRVGWEKTGNTYRTLPNQFDAQVTRSRVLLKCISDQPSGEKKNAQVEWEPQLFLNGVEQNCGKAPVLLETDPTNENYHQNVLEWDYGIAKRRIRIIEGRFRERWVFESNPHGDVRIKHNFNGNLELKLGYACDAEGKELQVRVTDDEEVVEASEFDKTIYPVEIGASMTFYPDAHVETSTVDGFMGRSSVNELWADITANAGNQHYDDVNWGLIPVLIQTYLTDTLWWVNRRAIALFDATGLPANAVLDLGELDLYGRLAADGGHKVDGLGIAPDANVYASTPASDIDLVNADYQELGSVPFCDTPKTYAAWSEGYNVFALNAAGLNAISKTLMSKFGIQNANYDVAQVTPAWSSNTQSNFVAYPSEKGNGYKPKLVVTYHLLIEGSASGEGIGEAETAGIRAAVGQPSGSGIGLATSEAKLDVIAQAQASGIGLATSEAKLDVLAQALGNGIGLSEAASYLIIPASASGQGIGLGTSAAYLIILAQAEASGIGLGTLDALLDVLAQARGSGIGLGATVPYLIIPASAIGSGIGEGLSQGGIVFLIEASASGIGLAVAEGIRAAVGSASASGIGLGTSQALLDVMARISGHGVGIGEARAFRVILLIRKPPPTRDLGKTKPYYTLAYPLPQVDYILGEVKPGSHNLGRRR